MSAQPELLDLFLELQRLDRVPRSGYLLSGVADPESVAEHAFHVALLAAELAPRHPGLDTAQAIEIALLHDLAEVRLGDLPRAAKRYLPRGAKAEAERAAFADLAAPLGERAWQLFNDYLGGRTREARFVRACDKLQRLLKVFAYESAGHAALADFWNDPANRPDASEFPLLADLATALAARRQGATG